jgi:hypothetical protein
MIHARWEVGSEFHWSYDWVRTSAGEPPLPAGAQIFTTGRAALLSLIRLLSKDRRRPTLHLPSYFCMEVAGCLQTVCDLGWYRDQPNERDPDLSTLRAAPGDLVLAHNVFGLRDGKLWRDWIRHHDGVTVIEDHSHDPFSPWARTTVASYVVSSLRKTLPLPDGALAWSPQGLPVPTPAAPSPPGAERKLAAMLLKGAYLGGGQVSKGGYREVQVQGERELGEESDSIASVFTRQVLPALDVDTMRRRRSANVERLHRALLDVPEQACRPLFAAWPDDAAPFNGVVLCPDDSTRDRLRRYLMAERIYCPVHWTQTGTVVTSGAPEAIDLSRRLLTIPADHRYGPHDIDRVAATVSAFAALG